MSEIKLCKDCKWKNKSRCAHPWVGNFLCSTERDMQFKHVSACGPYAKLFEPKPAKPWWRFW